MATTKILFELQHWVEAHGVPLFITILAIWLAFRYFLARLNSTERDCSPEIARLGTEVSELKAKVEESTIIVRSCQSTLISLKGFLSGIYFRNKGMEEDE